MLHAREVVEDENGIPYVVRTKFNNGIEYRVTETKKMIPSLKCVTLLSKLQTEHLLDID